MIVNYSEKGWSIVLQRSHGMLAAQICGHWKIENQPKRWVDTMIATAEHDDVSDELQEPELSEETGGPRNFKMKAFEAASCDKLLAKAFSKGRYVGMLIARHVRFLYQQEAAAKSYCKNLRDQEALWLKEAGTTAKEIAASYELLEFCDAFSLIICQGLVQPENRKMEISNGPDGKYYQLCTTNEGALTVTPWPFETDAFDLHYESRTVDQLVFKNAEELRKKLNAAPVTLHTTRVKRAD